MSKTFLLTGEEAYELVLAALDVVLFPSPTVLKKCRAGTYANKPGIDSRRLGALADVLDRISPGLIESSS